MIPLWAISGLAGAGIAGFLGYQVGSGIVQGRLDRERAAWAEIRVSAAQAAADWERKAREADARERDLERMRTDIARAIDHDATKQAEKLRADAGRAGAAVLGLRAQLGAVVADAARAAEAGARAADAGQREATAAATGMLAELLERCHVRSVARAVFADAAAAAGERCERWADALITNDSGVR
jgi:hypothetical protein